MPSFRLGRTSIYYSRRTDLLRSPGTSTHGRVGAAVIGHVLVSDAQRLRRNLGFSSCRRVSNFRLGQTFIITIFRLGQTYFSSCIVSLVTGRWALLRSPGTSTHGRVGAVVIDHALFSDAQRIHRNLSSDACVELPRTATKFSSWSDWIGFFVLERRL